MPHTENPLERMVREVVIYKGTDEIRRRVLATEMDVETGPLPLAAVG